MRSRHSGSPLLLVGASVRALAASAHRAGRPVCGLDCYGDQDTRELCEDFIPLPCGGGGLDGTALLRSLERLSRRSGSRRVVPAGGLEGLPEVLRVLARDYHLLGNPPAVFQRFTRPRRFFSLLDQLGIPHPETRFTPPPPDGRPWLCKRTGGCGGGHVRRWQGESEEGDYFQRELQGRPCSVCFLADGAGFRILGHSRLLSDQGDPLRPWRHGGCIAFRPSAARTRELEGTLAKLVLVGGLRGLCGMDYLELAEGGISVLEVNPRPPASFELFEAGDGLFEAHLRGVAGRLTGRIPEPDQLHGFRVLYLRQDLEIPEDWRWPEWCRDRPAPGSRLAAGEPLCTIRASAASGEALRERLLERGRAILEALGTDRGDTAVPADRVPMTSHAMQRSE